MPFDCTPIIDLPKQIPNTAVDALGISVIARSTGPVRPRPLPPWYVGKEPQRVDAAVAVLARAREIISDERRWCKRAFAFTWLDIPVPVGSRYARRFCALGAIKRAARELGLPVGAASRALEWQTVRPVADWNDDKVRTHTEVVAAFNAAIDALAVMTPAV
jgi:hypothetical protein